MGRIHLFGQGFPLKISYRQQAIPNSSKEYILEAFQDRGLLPTPSSPYITFISINTPFS